MHSCNRSQGHDGETAKTDVMSGLDFCHFSAWQGRQRAGVKDLNKKTT
jgi:hypothetical protein